MEQDDKKEASPHHQQETSSHSGERQRAATVNQPRSGELGYPSSLTGTRSEPLEDEEPGLPVSPGISGISARPDVTGTSARLESPVPAARPSRFSSVFAFISGLLACLFSLLLVTIPLGLLFGFAALISGFIAWRRYRRTSGLVLSLFSFLIAAVWIAGFVVPLAADPTIRVHIPYL
ncbi:hypothetical protein [Paenibacillus lutrae]|uniref:DUF4190 domain-containing protein n=1 Tax=Paenibacillus lutrae TaxID=2078573 RepID=A0A7X3K0D9_9BACL|nr:hypothetical protein [Paenibacillus lutrae]MVP00846.1 hypothetical protein [Paenibacillus lutrae]